MGGGREQTLRCHKLGSGAYVRTFASLSSLLGEGGPGSVGTNTACKRVEGGIREQRDYLQEEKQKADLSSKL